MVRPTSAGSQNRAFPSGTSGRTGTASLARLRLPMAQLAHPDGSHIDQISQIINQLRTCGLAPSLSSAWNVAELDKMALQPCHALFQFYVADGKLSCQLYQRSADMFLGVPFNISSYALLTHMVAQQVGLEVGEFVWTGGDCHILPQPRGSGARRFPVSLRLPHAPFEQGSLDLRVPHEGHRRLAGIPPPSHHSSSDFRLTHPGVTGSRADRDGSADWSRTQKSQPCSS